MKNKYVSGVLLLVLGVLIAVGPMSLFPVCEVNPEKIMKCHWTAQMELGVGLVVALVGLLTVLTNDAKVRQGMAMAAAPMGLLVVLAPWSLIGVCANAHMGCAALTRPALTILGILVMAVAALSALSLRNSK